MLRNKKVVAVLAWQGFVLWMLCSYVLINIVNDGTRIDYHTNDFLINHFRNILFEIPSSERIVYLSITDKTYKDYFQSNQFKRQLFASGLQGLKNYNPEVVIMDLIFAYPGSPVEDSVLEKQLGKFDKLFLPVSFALSNNNPILLKQNTGINDSDLNRFMGYPIIINKGNPYIGGRGLLTASKYLKLCTGIGHISDFPDDDGIYRHSVLLIKIDSLYLPSMYLSVFLDEINVPFEKINIIWGDKIIIPVLPDSWNNEVIEIPIDINGRVRIPFTDRWAQDFPNISLTTFNDLTKEEDKQGSLLDFFEGKFVFVCDISTGIIDIGNTSLSQTAPLVSIQANMLNALLTNTFFKNADSKLIAIILLIFISGLSISTFFTEMKIFYWTFFISLAVFLLIILFGLNQLLLFPVISLITSKIFTFIVLLIQVQFFTQKEKRYIEIENLRKQHEMEEAKKIQISMLPADLPKYEGVEIATYLSTASEVGGDYYDFYIDKENNLTFVIADATGHGLKAGTMVTVVKTLFIHMRDQADLKSILNKISGIIKQLKLPQLYVCLSYFRYKNFNLEFTSAGMPPLVIYRSNTDEIETIILKGMPLGHIANFPYSEAKIKLQKGDTILISSDGLTELFNEKNEMVDEKEIITLFKSIGKYNPGEIIIRFKKFIKEWCGKIEPRDDITIIIIKIV